jgi:hypothetical protein
MTDSEGGHMADSPFDEATPLDGMVGSFEDLQEAPPIATGVLQVFVSGGAVSGSRAIGLAEDLERLVHAFLERPASIGAEKSRVPEKPPAGEDEEIAIAFHGLELEPDAEAELHRLMRARIQGHLARGETEQ